MLNLGLEDRVPAWQSAAGELGLGRTTYAMHKGENIYTSVLMLRCTDLEAMRKGLLARGAEPPERNSRLCNTLRRNQTACSVPHVLCSL